MYSSKSLIELLFSLLYVVHILNKIQQNTKYTTFKLKFNYHLQISLWKYEYIRRN